MSSLRDRTDVELSNLRVQALAHVDTPLWAALRATYDDEITRIHTDLVDRELPGDKLKYAQGELAQANRGKLLVDDFLRAIDVEMTRRRRARERA